MMIVVIISTIDITNWNTIRDFLNFPTDTPKRDPGLRILLRVWPEMIMAGYAPAIKLTMAHKIIIVPIITG
jgi:hypothetical protein